MMIKKRSIFILAVLLTAVLMIFSSCTSNDDFFGGESQSSAGGEGFSAGELTDDISSDESTASVTTEHVHIEKTVPGASPTCTEDGTTDAVICEECGEILKAHSTLRKTGHLTWEDVPAVHGNCIEGGYTAGKKCRDCGYIKDVLPVKGIHGETEIVAGYPATCFATGLTGGERCKVCGELTVFQKAIERIDHQFAKVSHTGGGCGEYTSFEYDFCSICDESFDERGNLYHWPKQMHNFKNGKCTLCKYVPKASEGLEFELVDGKYYAVVGIDNNDTATIVIPAEYNGLPVKEVRIEKGDIYLCPMIYIPKTVTYIAPNVYSGGLFYSVYVEEGNPVYKIVGDFLINTEKKSVLRYVGTTENIVIPDGIGLEIIEEHAFWGIAVTNGGYMSHNVTSVTIPEGIKIIENNVLGGVFFWGIKELVIPSTVESIGKGNIDDCANLEKLVFPDGLKIINSRMFDYTKLTEIELPSGLESIPIDAFEGSKIKKVSIRDGGSIFKMIGNCIVNIKTQTVVLVNATENGITFPESEHIKHIGDDLIIIYNGKSEEYTINIPEGVKTIGSRAFGEFKSISTSIVFPSTLEEIRDDAFGTGVADKMKDETLDLSHTKLIKLGTNAFCGFTTLKNVRLPDTLEMIGENAFYNCYSLVSINIPDSVKEIGAGAFYYCQGLENITLPDGVTEIKNQAFYSTAIRKFAISKNITEIDPRAFQHTEKLEKIDIDPENKKYSYVNGNIIDVESKILVLALNKDNPIPSDGSVTKIGPHAFSCLDIKAVKIPETVTEIMEYAFYQSNIGEIEFHDGITSIGEYAFAKCKSLNAVIIPNSIKEIKPYCFSESSNIKKLVIGSSVEKIGECAFDSCSLITELIIPDSVTYIGKLAFGYCIKITDISIGKGLTYIAPDAMLIANNIKRIDISKDNATYVGNGRYILEKATGKLVMSATVNGEPYIPRDGSVKIIGSYALRGYIRSFSLNEYKEMTYIVLFIPNGVAEIEEHAFDYVQNDSMVDLPQSLEKIPEEKDFFGMRNAYRISFRGTVDEWKRLVEGLEWNETYVRCIDGECGKR